jgi:hypothetical protein
MSNIRLLTLSNVFIEGKYKVFVHTIYIDTELKYIVISY